ncbi:MAG: type III-B CRISPR module RAMP protein Cmr1 [Anaerolineae bacterium]
MSESPLCIHLKTLTPLWTGGVDQTCDRLHETGLIGGLRWWYEALVRGLGGYACDPTEHSCTFDEEKYPRSKAPTERQRLLDAGVCDACQLFGCTGWGRKFRLQISDGQKLLNGQNVLIPSGRKYQTQRGERAGGWFVLSESRIGEISIELIPLRDVDLRPIHTVLALIARHASFGPKGSSGYGVIQAENLDPSLSWLEAFPTQQPERSNTLPDLRDFFFARFQFSKPANNPQWWQGIYGIQQAANGKLDDGSAPNPLRPAQKELERMVDQGILPIAPAIRNWLRYQWQHNLSAAEAHFVFGEAQAVCPNCYQGGFRSDKNDPEKNWCPKCEKSFKKGQEIPTTASKIHVSYAYRLNDAQWEFRIWGWLPCRGQLKNRDVFLNSLKAVCDEKNGLWDFVFGKTRVIPKMVEWHVLDCQQKDGRAYLQQLLGGAP